MHKVYVGTILPADSPGPVPLGLAYVPLVETNPFFRTCRYSYGLCSSNIIRYFLDFALTYLFNCSLNMAYNLYFDFQGH